MAQLVRLRTLGAVYAARDDGAPLGGAAAQRRLLALLAVLAVAGEAGISRDKLLALLWPEGDPERARHALTQSLYHARRTLRCEELFLAGADIRLNPERITSDVRELEAALAAGELETAVELHRGPFLDGFFLAGVPEFEQWAAAQRARIAGLVAGALERLARRAERAGDLAGAVEWRRRHAALDPLDSGATIALVSALAAAGDRVGALQQARVHELLLREQLDVAPDRALVDLVERLRAEPAVAAEGAAGGAAVAAAELARPAEAPPAGATPTDATGPARGDAPRARGRWWRIALAAAALALAVAAGGALWRRGATPAAVASTPPQALVVAPFRVTGADPSLAYLREGLVELLASRLADDSAAHAVDPGVVLGAWRAARLADGVDVPRGDAVTVAQRLGATRVVVGSVIGGASRLVIGATLLDVPGGAAVAQASAEGPADSLTTLVDRLAARLLAATAGEEERFAGPVTPSLPALRAYLDGRASYRRGDYAAAVEQYERALAHDSTFALAALHLALSADRLNDAEQHDRALALAWAARDELGERDRSHLVAFAGPRYPAPSPEAEQLAAWERAAALAPDRAEVWYELGQRFFHHGAVLGVPGVRRRAESALRRALALDPSHAPPRRLLVMLAARAADTALLRQIASPAAIADSMGRLAPFVRWRVAVARGDEGALRPLRAGLARLDDANLRAIAMASQFDAVGIADGERALRILRLRVRRAAEQFDALLAQHSLALLQGRPVLALDVTEQLEELQPGARAHLRLRVLDALYAEGDSAAAAEAAAALARSADAPPAATPEARAVQAADACVLEQWRLARGRTRATPRVVAALREAVLPRTPVPSSANPRTCAELLDAAWAVATGRRDALARVERVDSLMLGGPAVSDAGTYSHLLVARLYERLGEPERALVALRRRAYMTGWPRYLATARREEGRLAAAVGDAAGARDVYRRYLALRAAPEERVAPQVAEVRAALARLGRD